MENKTKNILKIIGILLLLYFIFVIGYLEGARKNTKTYIEGYKEGLDFNAQENFNQGYKLGYEEGYKDEVNITTNNIFDNCFNYYCNLDLDEWNCISEQNINITRGMCYDIIFNNP